MKLKGLKKQLVLPHLHEVITTLPVDNAGQATRHCFQGNSTKSFDLLQRKHTQPRGPMRKEAPLTKLNTLRVRWKQQYNTF